jgi:PKD repeat protein
MRRAECQPDYFFLRTMAQLRRSLSVPFFLLLASVFVFGQNRDAAVIRLQYETRVITGGLSSSSTEYLNYARAESAQGGLYLYLHFQEIPNAKERQQYERLGIRFLAYLPERTYLVAVPDQLVWEGLPESEDFALSRVDVKDKWGKEGRSVDRTDLLRWLIVPYPGISLESAEKRLLGLGLEIEELEPEAGAIALRASYESLFSLSQEAWVQYVEALSEAIPENGLLDALHQTGIYHHSGAASLQLEGAGVNIALGDDGFVGPHIDFSERLWHSPNINTEDQGQHADLVAGIIAGNGNLDPMIRGVAPQAELTVVNDFDAVKQAQALFEKKGVVATCTAISDGCNRGYSTLANLADRQIWENPALMHVFSAGNAGLDDCDFGAGAGWGNITGGVKMAKNVLTIGFVDKEGKHLPTSSRGPATDGRIKPELVAYGAGTPSTLPAHTYGELSGSSAAAPVVAGIWAQLVEGYRLLQPGQDPPSALIKALLLNTAHDLGKPGPDFTYGWGMPDARAAWDNLKQQQYQFDTLDHKEQRTYSIFVPDSLQKVNFLLYWHDHEASPSSAKALVNDLDFLVISPSGDTLSPWALHVSKNPVLLDLPATNGRDSLNNVEQVSLAVPEAGLYTLLIKGSNIPFGPQAYVLNWSFFESGLQLNYPIGGETFAPGEEVLISWHDSKVSAGPYSVEYSLDNGQSWNLLTTVPVGQDRYTWQIPQMAAIRALIRISTADGRETASSAFSILPVPEGLQVLQVCGNSVFLAWESTAGADSYLVYQLKGSRMDSVAHVGEPQAILAVDSPEEEHWYAISAVFEDSIYGRRCPAISDGVGLVNCKLANDIAIRQIYQPDGSLRPDCFSQNLPVSVLAENKGVASQVDFSFCYSLNGAEPVCEAFGNVLPPETSLLFTFSEKLQLSAGANSLKVWSTLMADEANYNDTLYSRLTVIPGISYSLPYFETFDDFPGGNPYDDCQTPYTAVNGWINDANGPGDGIDWRANRGATPTLNTGPAFDQNTRSGLGSYLYLESSKGCFGQKASLLSPCIDLAGSDSPRMTFWYHMKGEDMGTLHLDIFDGEKWIPNIISPLIGNKGDEWQLAEANLSSFSGKTVMLRFRGYTGDGYLSDLAIDNVSFFDAFSAPVAGIILEKKETCPGEPVQLLDNSINNPETWTWHISPSTFSFIGNSTAASADPEVSFWLPGIYTISLTVGNSFGTAQSIQEQQILVSQGVNPAYTMDFEEEVLFQKDWINYNEDGDIGWSFIEVKNKKGELSKAIYLNNHSYTQAGEQDILQSPLIDLQELKEPILRFDLSYTSYSEVFEDHLIVRVSRDCGQSFEEVIYSRKGEELATTFYQPNSWYPEGRKDWRVEEINLSDFKGESVTFQIVNICGFGNNLFLDNFWVGEKSEFPYARIGQGQPDHTFCTGDTLQFYYAYSDSIPEEISWKFGAAAFPEALSGPGPHSVHFSAAGLYDIQLETRGANTFDVANVQLEVAPKPSADFDYRQKEDGVLFVNHSSFAENYHWDFGDGSADTGLSPMHTYSRNAVYEVQLSASSVCGQDDFSQIVVVDYLEEFVNRDFQWKMLPNPANAFFALSIQAPAPQWFSFVLWDSYGRPVQQHSYFAKEAGNHTFSVDVSSLPNGLYIGQLSSPFGNSTQKIIINR